MCYKSVEALTANKPRVIAPKIYEPKVKREDLRKKPKKDSAPDMGSYEPAKVAKALHKQGLSQKWDTGPVVKFYEKQVKLSKHVPSCNYYKVTTDAYNRLSRSPPSIAMKRH